MASNPLEAVSPSDTKNISIAIQLRIVETQVYDGRIMCDNNPGIIQ